MEMKKQIYLETLKVSWVAPYTILLMSNASAI